MSVSLCLIAAKFNTTLNLKTAIWATSATLDSATDDSGVALPTGRYGLTIDGGTAAEEFITCTLTSTALTSIKTVTMQGVETSGMTKTHRKGATVKITDFVVIKKMLDNLNGTTWFNSSVTLGYDGTATISSANQFATKAYVDATATGTTNFDQVVIAWNAGETVSAGQLLYLDVADGEWKLCDADNSATVDNIILGLAQWAGTDGVAITGGILTYGLDTNQTGLTNNAPYFASNTAGGISTSAGTVEVSVGVARSTTSLFFDPRYNQQITEDIQDALVGTSGTPSGSNKYVTNDDTATAATASKVARRLAGGNITVVTEAAGTSDTNAASTAFAAAAGAKKVSITTTDVVVANTTAETTLLSVSIPGNTLGTNNAVRARLFVSTSANQSSDVFALKLKYGTTTLITLSNVDGQNLDLMWYIDCYLFGSGATNTQEGNMLVELFEDNVDATVVANGRIRNFAVGTAAEDSTWALNLVVTIQFSGASAPSANDTITVSQIIVDKII